MRLCTAYRLPTPYHPLPPPFYPPTYTHGICPLPSPTIFKTKRQALLQRAMVWRLNVGAPGGQEEEGRRRQGGRWSGTEEDGGGRRTGGAGDRKTGCLVVLHTCSSLPCGTVMECASPHTHHTHTYLPTPTSFSVLLSFYVSPASGHSRQFMRTLLSLPLW